jgi:cation diffusion facilitator CzcD-associated flavoprotein CzcO
MLPVPARGDPDRAAPGTAPGVPMPYRVAVIGAGFGGIGMAIALKRAGIGDFVVLDRAADLGGTWRDNTYPGLTCDVPSHLYSFSFRPWRWSRRFPARDEILAYLHALAAEHGLTPHLRFGCGVVAAEFDERGAVWNLTLDGGGTLQAAAVVCAVGQLGRPAFPDIPGRDTFAGPSWHSARWNHDADLTGRRVAVIGTGASAIQFVPEIARTAAHVDVYQRSAPYVLPKADRPYTASEQALFDRLPVVRKADRLRIFLYGELLTSGFVLSPKLLAGPMQIWRRHLRAQIADPALRARCVPDYLMGCKRVVFSNAWYPALTRPDVELVTDRIERIVPEGVITADGTARRADVIVYGTGFTAVDFLAPMRVTGAGGRPLAEAWRDGAQAYLGITVSGFPNFFMLYGPNTNLGGNSIIYMLEGQVGYVLAALRALQSERLAWIDVRPEVQEAFNSWVQSASRRSVWESGCHSWYTTASGRNTNNWPSHTFLYRHRVRRFGLSAYRVRPARPAACARAYADPSAWASPLVSPLAAHGSLPPLLIQAGTDELLAPDAGLLAAGAAGAGVDVTYTRWPRLWHDFPLQPGLLAAADSALAQAAWFVRRVTAGS